MKVYNKKGELLTIDSLIKDLTASIVSQLVNMGVITISAAQWAMLGSSNEQGDSGYIRIGDVQICWGTVAQITCNTGGTVLFYGAGTTITFPAAFKAATTPQVTFGITTSSGDNGVALIARGLTNTQITTPQAWHQTNNGTVDGHYIAIGVWQ